MSFCHKPFFYSLNCVSFEYLKKGFIMICPYCASKTKVVGTVTGLNNKRFRECTKPECARAFTTIEAIQFDDYWRIYAQATFKSDNQIQRSE